MYGEENDFRGRRDAPDFVRSLDAIHDGHIDVEEHEIGMQFFDFFDGLLAVFRFAANLHGVPVK